MLSILGVVTIGLGQPDLFPKGLPPKLDSAPQLPARNGYLNDISFLSLISFEDEPI